MNILLTNDDGYFATGINLLKYKLSKYGRVVVVAPKKAMSAKSVSITIGESVEVKKLADDFYYMEGTPADCVAFGLSSLNVKFDIVIGSAATLLAAISTRMLRKINFFKLPVLAALPPAIFNGLIIGAELALVYKL